jgi:prepilin-type processing-associated H-X9-DG protein
MAEHFLFTLDLPDRFEALVDRLGADLAKLLVPLSSDAHKTLDIVMEAVRTSGRGVFLPIHGATGAGMQWTRYNMPMTNVFREGTSSANSEVMFTHPSSTIMLTESSNVWYQHYHPSGTGSTATSGDDFYILGSLNETTWPRHGEGCNVLWIDGHVEAKRIRNLADASVDYWDRD